MSDWFGILSGYAGYSSLYEKVMPDFVWIRHSYMISKCFELTGLVNGRFKFIIEYYGS